MHIVKFENYPLFSCKRFQDVQTQVTVRYGKFNLTEKRYYFADFALFFKRYTFKNMF